MYGGGNIFEATKFDDLATEDPVKLAEFEARIARGEKIEPRIDTGVELVTRERLEKEPEIRKLVGLQ